MRNRAEIDAGGLPRLAPREHPLWWGVLGVVTIEATVVATLIASYFYLWMGAAAGPPPGVQPPEALWPGANGVWPPAGVQPPELLWPSVNVVLLLASAGTMYWAGRGINRGSSVILTLGTGASVLLASLVLVFRSLEIREFDFRWDDHPYGSIVWAITGFHFTHVASAIVGTAVVTLLAWRGYFTRERQLGVVVDTLYWYFVAGAWVPLYLVLYWAPRLL